MLFQRQRKVSPGRQELLASAAKLVTRGKLKSAADAYREVLKTPGADPATHVRLGEVLSRLRQEEDASAQFELAVQQYRHKGFDAKAIGVCRTAVELVPRRFEFWRVIADSYREQGKLADTIKTLLQARGHFRKGKDRPTAIEILRMVRQIEPWHFRATFDLARLLRQTGERDEACALYEGLAARSYRRHLRRARWALFSMSPTPGAAWRWLRAVVVGR